MLLLLWTVRLFGQGYAEKTIIDSLKNELSKDDLHDTTYINLLSEIGDQTPIFRISYWDTIANLADKKLDARPPITAARALRIALAGALNNIGFIHQHQGDIPLALEYYHKSLKIQEETRLPDGQVSDKKGMAGSYNNIGAIHKNQGDIPLALEYYHKSLKIKEKISDKKGMALSYNNIGVIHKNQGDIPLALEYYHKALKISEEIGDKQGTASYLANIGTLQLEAGKERAARNMGERGLKISLELGFPDQIARNAALLAKVARKQGRFKEALEMFELQVQYRDSMKNEETQKAALRQQTKYEFEPKTHK